MLAEFWDETCLVGSIVTIFGKLDGQKCSIWPGQLVSEASRGLLDVFAATYYFPIKTPEGAKATTAHKGVKTG